MELEQEVNQLEVNIRLKQSEIKILQNELETLHQMIKQLENQKIEARKRLDEMTAQNSFLDDTVNRYKNLIEELRPKVENLRTQVDEQKDKIESQENELNAKRKELEELKSEEAQLVNKLAETKKTVESLSGNLANSQLQISQYKVKLVHLEEYEQRLENGSSELESAINAKDIDKLNGILTRPITPLTDVISDFHEQKDDFESGSFMDKDGGFMSLGNEFHNDPFAGEDPFNEDDPFKKDSLEGDAFFSNDNFSSSNNSNAMKSSGFDPFNNSFNNNRKDSSGDPFGADPFSSPNRNNSIPRSESPAPELPPKKSKAPPPRPAPPKPGSKAPPPRPAPPSAGNDAVDKKTADPWASIGDDPFAPTVGANNATATSNFDAFGSNFADFANFDQVEIPKPVDPYATLASIARMSSGSTRRGNDFTGNIGQQQQQQRSINDLTNAFAKTSFNNDSPWN